MTQLFPPPNSPFAAPLGQAGLAAALARALSGQKAIYAQILALCKQQSQYVATGETEHLMTILAARNRLIEQVAPLDRELQPYKGRWQQVLDGLPGRERQTVGGLLKEVQELLAAILAADEADKESLTRQRTYVASEISRTVTGATLNRAYGIKPRVAGA
ncbi:MAG TPA: hypothetical protein VH253_05395 [Phycisphaerae bacterium]|nr:hypothetical protein [Phycisphaerae bacterium]